MANQVVWVDIPTLDLDRAIRFYSTVLGSPVETALAAAHLAMSGILERHPDMTVCLAHAGGASAAAMHGQEHVLFGSDWPFSMGLPDPHKQLADTDAGLRRLIFQDNPRRFFPSW